jgi:hypothetical protein
MPSEKSRPQPERVAAAMIKCRYYWTFRVTRPVELVPPEVPVTWM